MSRENSESQLARELEEARSQLEEYKETLRAIRSGEVDALLVSTDVGDRVFKLEDKTYRLLFETLNEGTLTLSSDGSILYSNKAFADLVGAPLENVIGKPIFEFTSDKDVVGGYLDRTLSGMNVKDVEIELLNAGVQVTCEASTALIKDEDDIPQTVIVIIRDITERKRLEDELRDASEYAQDIVNTVREPLVVLDDKLRVVSANRSFYSTFDVTGEMSENVLLYDLGNGQWDIPKLLELLEEVLQKSTTIEDFEVEHDFPAIGRKTMLLNARRIRSKTGATEILLAIEDITERLNLLEKEKELAAVEAAEKNAQKNAQELRDILAIASHELRHPATIFKGYSHILLENADNLDSEVARDALMSIDSASDRLVRTINQLTDASRIESGKMSLSFKEFEPHTLLNRVTAEFQGTGANINTSDKTVAGAAFKADREKLRSVLANLVENAVKFSPDGSPVGVRVEVAPGGFLFSVCDEGPGIPEEHAELVFERFYQVEEVVHHSIPGMGLGLYIAKTIVDEHGGWIRCRPAETGGSVFEFFIPEHPEIEVGTETGHEHAGAEPSPLSEPRHPDETRDDAGLDDDGTERVLRVAVIDDDPDIVKVNMMMLKSRGYEAMAAYGGKEGIEMVSRETPDVVLLDIMMPGLDGIETCRRLKSDERTRDIPVIFVTAKTSEECSEEALAAGGSGVLNKPFKPNELFESIEQVCGAVRT